MPVTVFKPKFNRETINPIYQKSAHFYFILVDEITGRFKFVYCLSVSYNLSKIILILINYLKN